MTKEMADSLDQTAAHWTRVYEEKDRRSVSWFEETPTLSLELIELSQIDPDAAIVDVGGGASTLAAELIARGFRDVTVTDVSAPALAQARAAAGQSADDIRYVQRDVRLGLEQTYDLWHDRAVFHFMVDPGDRDAYLRSLRSGSKPGGHVVIATFGPHGPEQCSNLPVSRYSAPELGTVLGRDFELRASQVVDHHTPSGSRQEFMYALFETRRS